MPSLSPRSYLFVPGNRPDRLAKACAAGAKMAARAAVAAWLTPAQPVLVRINVANSEWFRDDLKLGGKPGIAGVLLPKAESIEDIHIVAGHFGTDAPVLPQIETAQGFWNALAMARAGGVQRLLFGSIDLQLDLGMAAQEEELLFFRSQIVLVSRLAAIQSPVDGVTTDIN